MQDPEFEFGGGASNSATSGGFGPNQVSAILGLGLVAIVVYLIVGRAKRVVTGTMLLLTLFLARQCLITLSRGGVYMALGAVAAASFYLLRDRAYRGKLLAAGAVVGAILVFVVIPRLEAITGGVLVSRFENTSGTGRELLIKADLESWAENPVLGVGPGLGGKNRLKYFHVPTAHTEYTRMLAEHGLLGLVSLVLLGAMAVRSVREPEDAAGQGRLRGLSRLRALLHDGERDAVCGPGVCLRSLQRDAGRCQTQCPRRRAAASARRPSRRRREFHESDQPRLARRGLPCRPDPRAS